jgi:hypothetical protein
MSLCFLCGESMGLGSNKGMCAACLANNLILRQNKQYPGVYGAFCMTPDGNAVWMSAYEYEDRFIKCPVVVTSQIASVLEKLIKEQFV